MPASLKALATIFAPRSWLSKPGFATITLIFLSEFISINSQMTISSRYSPNTSRNTLHISPSVAYAFAAWIIGGIKFSSCSAAWRTLSRASFTFLLSRCSRSFWSLASCFFSTSGFIRRISKGIQSSSTVYSLSPTITLSFLSVSCWYL